MLPRRLPYGFRCLQLLLKGLFSFRSLHVGPHYEITANPGDNDLGKKKEDDLSWTICVLKSLRVMLSDSLIRIYSQSWGSSVDALNTTYPSPLPDHRVFLTVVFVPRVMLWLQLQLVASRCFTFAPERLIGIF